MPRKEILQREMGSTGVGMTVLIWVVMNMREQPSLEGGKNP